MNIAIPVYGDRVMPRFGCAREMIIVSVEDEDFLLKKRVSIGPEDFLSLPDFLVAEKISLVICGGIHPRFQQFLAENQIRILWGAMGDWQNVLQSYQNGTLETNPRVCRHHGSRRNSRFRHGQGGEDYAEI
jgi:predicted Fe-Mo cluster-binding NifX family protein